MASSGVKFTFTVPSYFWTKFLLRDVRFQPRRRCVLLRCYAAGSGNSFLTFGTNYRVQSSRVKNQKGTLVWNYHNSLRNKPNERSYHHLKQFLISFLLLLIFLISVFWYRLCDKRPHLTPWKPVNNTPKLEEIK